MKEWSSNKILIVKIVLECFTHPAPKIDQVDSENKVIVYSNMIQEKVVKSKTLRSESSQSS